MRRSLLLIGLLIVFSSVSQALVVGVEGGNPYVRFIHQAGRAVDLGFTYNNASAANNNVMLWGRYNNKIAVAGKVTTSWGAGLNISAGKVNNVTTNILTLTGILSASYTLAENVAVYGNINVLNIVNTTAAGAATTAYSVLAGSAQAYSGIRVNI